MKVIEVTITDPCSSLLHDHRGPDTCFDYEIQETLVLTHFNSARLMWRSFDITYGSNARAHLDKQAAAFWNVFSVK